MASSPPTLITPKFVFGYPLSPNVSDYRCVVNADATAVIVERTVLNAEGHGTPELYIVDLASRTATPFLKVVNDIPIGNTTRPDWCWRTGQVAFNCSKSPRVGVVDATGVDPRVFPNTANMDYPTWFPDGETLATESGHGSPNPNTTTLDPKTGTIIAQALEGTNLYGGMPSVNPAYPNLIAFAGQPVGSPYDQDMNYIWVKDLSSPVPAVPLEYNAPATGDFCPAFQGRAPWWSPDGKWVVFESNRGCVPGQVYSDGMYAIYLYEYGVRSPAFAITDWAYNFNHAKWFPNGFAGRPAGPFQLIAAAWQNGSGTTPAWPYGLAILDLTSLGITF
jgi:Tol biopolymer transport system component